jgi:hypothetical protein
MIYPTFVVSLLVTSIASAASPVNLGLYSEATGEFQISTGLGNPPITSFSFGVGGPGFVPLSGDWDGDGDDTVGLYTPASGTFFLRNSNTPGPADIEFIFGAGGTGFVPLSGDWDGDGDDTIGIYTPASGTFFLRNSNTPGPADIEFVFGAGGTGDVPIKGDYDGDGKDTISIYTPASGTFFLRNSNTPGPADTTVNFGDSSTLPLVFGVIPEPSTIGLVALSCATILMSRTCWRRCR